MAVRGEKEINTNHINNTCNTLNKLFPVALTFFINCSYIVRFYDINSFCSKFDCKNVFFNLKQLSSRKGLRNAFVKVKIDSLQVMHKSFSLR